MAEGQLVTRLVRPGETPPAGAQPLMAVAYRCAGLRRGGRGMACLVSWAIAETRLGRPLGGDVDGRGHTTAAIREYAEWWKQSERTTWRDLVAFRAAFPGEETPARLAAEIRAVRALRAETGQAEGVALAGSLLAV